MTTAEIEATYFDVLMHALQGLNLAVRDLREAYKDVARPPRPRFLVISPNLTWPYVVPGDGWSGEKVYFHMIWDRGNRWHPAGSSYLELDREADRRELAQCILADHHLRPKQVYRALRRLQVACIWCQDRKAGVEREIDEIFRQQARWHALMTREHHFLELGGSRQP